MAFSNSAFICPITLNTMNDPWSDSDGNTYEKDAIFEWIRLHNTSPITRNPMNITSLVPNRALKNLIEQSLGLQTSTTKMTDKQHKTVKRDNITTIILADVSGSMQEICSNRNSGEETFYTRLDLVKHTINTIIESLTEDDHMGLIKFENCATPLCGIIPMNDQNKQLLRDRTADLSAGGGTNIWDALRVAIDLANNYNLTSSRIDILLFTDGISNNDPPRGIIGTLTSYLNQHPNLNVTLNTYGFGYQINSKLLYDISSIKKGIFGFIPDSTMIGTVLVNSIAYLMTNTCLTQLNRSEIIIRDTLVECLQKGNIQDFIEFANSYQYVKFAEDILKDCIETTDENDGQLCKAFNPSYYQTWGMHYIYSVISAYTNLFCLNFKDNGIKHFGNPYFSCVQRHIENLFINLPPPIPTGKSERNTHTALSSAQFSMSFYNPSGGCFLENTRLKLADGTFIPVQDVRKSMVLSSIDETSTIVCVVKLKFSGIIRKSIDKTTTALTPYHPVFFNNYNWLFPQDSEKFYDVNVNDVYVYDYILDNNHVVELEGGIYATTFNHQRQGDVIGHQYFGTHKIVLDLIEHPAWISGFIQLDQYEFIRDPESNQVVKLKF